MIPSRAQAVRRSTRCSAVTWSSQSSQPSPQMNPKSTLSYSVWLTLIYGGRKNTGASPTYFSTKAEVVLISLRIESGVSCDIGLWVRLWFSISWPSSWARLITTALSSVILLPMTKKDALTPCFFNTSSMWTVVVVLGPSSKLRATSFS